MCLIIGKPAGVDLPENLEDICKEASEVNDDGFGFATKNRVWKKTNITPEMFSKILRKCISKNDNAIIHFRYGTAGHTSRINCHPYVLPDGTRFAHNGNISDKYKPENGFSDTAILAMTAKDINDLASRCKELSGPNNKFAMIDPYGFLHIIGAEYGEWRQDKMWYSNSYWMRGNRKRSYSYEYTTSSNYYDELDTQMYQLMVKYGYARIRSELDKLYIPRYQRGYDGYDGYD